MPGTLVLFDIDGTLLIDDAYAHGLAMVQAARDVYGVDLADDAVMTAQPHGKTDREILRAMLYPAGLGDGAIDARIADWTTAAAERFADVAAGAAAHWTVRPGLAGLLAELRERGDRASVLTGNLEPIARTKLRLMEVDTLIDLDAGAYGTDAEDRAALVPLARQRAGGGTPWPREAAVVVGDTAADAAAAHADGLRAVLFDTDHARGADAVISDIEELPALLDAWAR